MFVPILEVCPSFQAAWNEFVAEWEDEPGELPHYLALAELARHLISLLERNETETIRDVFLIVERWHLEGEPYVKEAATIGLLEDLQNLNLHERKTVPDDFLEFLPPETRFWWVKVTDFWEKGELIADGRKID